MTTTPLPTNHLHAIGGPTCVTNGCEPDLPHFAMPNPEAKPAPISYVPRRAK